MSFAEVLAALGLIAVLAADAARFGQAALWRWEELSVAREIHHSLAVTAEMFEREWRVAGFHASGQSLLGVVEPTSQSIQLRADLNGDGDVADAHERIEYTWDPSRHAVMRATQGASPQPWLSDVPEGGFALRYLDSSGQEIPADQASSQARAVVLSLRVQRSSSARGESSLATQGLSILRARRNG